MHGSDNVFTTKLINSVGIDHLGFYAMQKKLSLYNTQDKEIAPTVNWT